MSVSSGCSTVLMSVRVSVRPLRVGSDSLRLQLSMNSNRPGHFTLTLRHTDRGGRSVSLAEFDLCSMKYDVTSARCHELHLTKPPFDSLTFTFRSEQEAQEWATVMMSSLREAHRVANISHLSHDGMQFKKCGEKNFSLSTKEELCIELSQAIEAGDARAAMRYASDLAQHQIALTIQPSLRDTGDSELSLAVVIEDATSACTVTVKILPHMTVSSLKQQMFLEYGFHPKVQRWVIGQCLCTDARSLASYGVCRDGDTAFLYLLSARHACLSQQQCQKEQEKAVLLTLNPTPVLMPASSTSSVNHDWRGYSTLPPRFTHSSSAGGGSTEKPSISDIINLDILQLGESKKKSSNTQLGWSCPSCTFINKFSRPGCEICSTDRPNPPNPTCIHQEKIRRSDQ